MRVISALWLAVLVAAPAAAAQNRAVSPVKLIPADAVPAVGAAVEGARTSFVAPAAALWAPAPVPTLAAPAVSALNHEADESSPGAPVALVVEDAGTPLPVNIPLGELSSRDPRETAAVATVARVVASWDAPRTPQTLGSATAEGSSGAPLERPSPRTPRAHGVAARVAFFSGGVMVAAAVASFAAPALFPVALVAVKGHILYFGFMVLTLARFWREPETIAPTPGPPPAAAPEGRFKSLKAAWSAARGGADAQISLEAHVGGSSLKSLSDWLLGGLRAAALWIPVALAGMLVGRGLSQPFARFAGSDPRGMVSEESALTVSFGGHLLGYVAASLASQVLTLGVFDEARLLARRLGAGRAADLIGGAAALAVSAALILMVTTTPSVVGCLLGIEAGLLWLRARSSSWLAPLALRAMFSMFSIEAARLGVRLVEPSSVVHVAALKGLPDVWTGVAVAGMLLGALAWLARGVRPSALWAQAKAQVRRVSDFGRAWLTPTPDGAPHSPWPLFKLASLWGLILYAVGDLTFSGVHALAPAAEPTPPILAQMLGMPVDLILYNFLIVGFLEEFVFRGGLFKSLAKRLAHWKGTGGKSFWAAAAASGVIFSCAHYVDFGALLAHVGIGNAAAASGVAGTYAFTLAGFMSRAVLGALLAWLYASSGTLLLPILAHFLADSYEGLGLRFGFWPFLAMGAAALLIQRVNGRRPAA